MNAATKLYPL